MGFLLEQASVETLEVGSQQVNIRVVCVGGRSGAPGQRDLSCCISPGVTVGPCGGDGGDYEVEG